MEKETLWLHGFLSGLELTNAPKPYEKSKPTKKQKKALLHFEKRLKVDKRVKMERNDNLTLSGKKQVNLILDTIDFLAEQGLLNIKGHESWHEFVEEHGSEEAAFKECEKLRGIVNEAIQNKKQDNG